MSVNAASKGILRNVGPGGEIVRQKLLNKVE
jgi:hypothetical protein